MARFKADSLTKAGGIINRLTGSRNRLYLKYTWEMLVQKTPVDTYTASNSWFVTGGAPSKEKPEYKYYGRRPDTPPALRSDFAFKISYGSYKNWFITNNQDYILGLERGTANRPPTPWIESTIRRMTKLANSGAF